ncbi:hypothetical protein WJX73_009151 [Symbiochloris irregularis]|uniref:Uncharacterized protein n=1 Tax=Symbiochloris irregularis TaxID=706552 RepID=A0AAW1NV55_9CHLO
MGKWRSTRWTTRYQISRTHPNDQCGWPVRDQFHKTLHDKTTTELLLGGHRQDWEHEHTVPVALSKNNAFLQRVVIARSDAGLPTRLDLSTCDAVAEVLYETDDVGLTCDETRDLINERLLTKSDIKKTTLEMEFKQHSVVEGRSITRTDGKEVRYFKRLNSPQGTSPRYLLFKAPEVSQMDRRDKSSEFPGPNSVAQQQAPLMWGLPDDLQTPHPAGHALNGPEAVREGGGDCNMTDVSQVACPDPGQVDDPALPEDGSDKVGPMAAVVERLSGASLHGMRDRRAPAEIAYGSSGASRLGSQAAKESEAAALRAATGWSGRSVTGPRFDKPGADGKKQEMAPTGSDPPLPATWRIRDAPPAPEAALNRGQQPGSGHSAKRARTVSGRLAPVAIGEPAAGDLPSRLNPQAAIFVPRADGVAAAGPCSVPASSAPIFAPGTRQSAAGEQDGVALYSEGLRRFPAATHHVSPPRQSPGLLSADQGSIHPLADAHQQPDMVQGELETHPSSTPLNTASLSGRYPRPTSLPATAPPAAPGASQLGDGDQNRTGLLGVGGWNAGGSSGRAPGPSSAQPSALPTAHVPRPRPPPATDPSCGPYAALPLSHPPIGSASGPSAPRPSASQAPRGGRGNVVRKPSRRRSSAPAPAIPAAIPAHVVPTQEPHVRCWSFNPIQTDDEVYPCQTGYVVVADYNSFAASKNYEDNRVATWAGRHKLVNVFGPDGEVLNEKVEIQDFMKMGGYKKSTKWQESVFAGVPYNRQQTLKKALNIPNTIGR